MLMKLTHYVTRLENLNEERIGTTGNIVTEEI